MDIGAMMKQAQALQAKMQQAQATLANTLLDGEAGGGMVKLTLNGTGELKALTIDESLMEAGGAELLADLVIAAHNQAIQKLEATRAGLMQNAAGPLAGLIPGM